MKITVITGPFFPLPPFKCGAIERLWNDLATEFASMGHSVRFISKRMDDQLDREVVNGVEHVRIKGMTKTGKLPIDLVKDFVYSSRALKAVESTDILTLNSFWLPYLAPRRFRGKHSTARPKIIANIHRFPKRQIGLYKDADRVLGVSGAIADAIISQQPAIADRVRVIANPIDTATFVPPAVERDYSDLRQIIFTGRIHPEKGIHVLIDAFRRLTSTTEGLSLRIVGPHEIQHGGGGETYMKQLRSSAEGLPVVFSEAIYDRTELARALQHAHYYCYPSLADKGEAFGVAPLEAMGTGLPVVVSNLACFRDLIVDGVTGLYFDHHAADPAGALVAALTKVLEIGPEMGRRAAQAATQFSVSEIARRYIADFEELLSQPCRDKS